MIRQILVLRLDHRRSRDVRISTHVFLTARAFGCNKGFFTGDNDLSLISSVDSVVRQWGGDFSLDFVKSYKYLFHKLKDFKIVHLTMYGLPVQHVIKDIRAYDNLLVVVGGSKVPGEVYGLADFNVSITSQPHSEVSSLAVFLDRLFMGQELDLKFDNARHSIVPQQFGKKIVKL